MENRLKLDTKFHEFATVRDRNGIEDIVIFKKTFFSFSELTKRGSKKLVTFSFVQFTCQYTGLTSYFHPNLILKQLRYFSEELSSSYPLQPQQRLSKINLFIYVSKLIFSS